MRRRNEFRKLPWLALWCGLLGWPQFLPAARAPLLPDLAVTRVEADGRCRVRVTLANRGPGALPAAAYSARAGAVLRLELDRQTPLLVPLQRLDLHKRLRRPGGRVRWTADLVIPGRAGVAVVVDATGRVREADERNNRMSRSLACDARPAPTPGARVSRRGSAVVDSGTRPATDHDPIEETPPEAPPVATDGGSLLEAPPPAVPDSDTAAPAADGPEVEPGELLVASPGMDEARALARRAQALGLRVRRRRTLEALGMVVSVLEVPRGMTVAEARRMLREALPEARRGQVEANHRYLLQGATSGRRYALRVTGWKAGTACGRGVRLGLVDTGVAAHPALARARVERKSFVTPGWPLAPADHGTAVAALLAGQGEGRVQGLVPGARLYAAGVFRRRGRDTVDTTTEWLLHALDWLLASRVQVINLSLGGPRNMVLEAALRRVMDRGVAVAAAAGNGGPGGAPVYPAAQRGVVAVTAVDARLRPWSRATAGDYIDFAAPGVDLWTARGGGGYAYVSGTSYATPFVSAALALLTTRGTAGEAAVEALRRRARDLGPPGRDARFGWGLIRAPGPCGG